MFDDVFTMIIGLIKDTQILMTLMTPKREQMDENKLIMIAPQTLECSMEGNDWH